MIIFDLICAQRHIFEGWFSSSEDYEAQKRRDILSCPTCGSADISKSVMAPNIGLKSNQKSPKPSSIDINKSGNNNAGSNNAPSEPVQSKPSEAVQSIVSESEPSNNAHLTNSKDMEAIASELVKLQKAVLKNSTWVGSKFAQEARSIYYDEADKRQIHGHATQNEAAELKEEGIDIAALPMPFIPPDLKN